MPCHHLSDNIWLNCSKKTSTQLPKPGFRSSKAKIPAYHYRPPKNKLLFKTSFPPEQRSKPAEFCSKSSHRTTPPRARHLPRRGKTRRVEEKGKILHRSEVAISYLYPTLEVLRTSCPARKLRFLLGPLLTPSPF